MIRSQALACRFDDGKALRFADVDVPQGGTLLLRGPSGSGKSTWLALAAGLRSATGRRAGCARGSSSVRPDRH